MTVNSMWVVFEGLERRTQKSKKFHRKSEENLEGEATKRERTGKAPLCLKLKILHVNGNWNLKVALDSVNRWTSTRNLVTRA